ncbi:MAG: glycosyltransferase [Solirubrobacterales bacterium]|nr:glycosyltransferase [Solirubrobacterales bacterium]
MNVAICMATHEPAPELFRAQVESIRAQEGVEWTCFVSDDCSGPEAVAEIERTIGGDARFVFSRSDRRLGFYRNFERAIGMVPDSFELISLSDQDDRWYPDKLRSLIDAMGSAGLAYSDQRLVREDGTVIADTYWTVRQNNHTDLTSMLVANTVTGAASIFTREVAHLALPFPEVPGEQYHDHWLALVALSIGEIAYVDRPLYDYVQHGGAVLGHEKANAGLQSLGLRRLDPRRWREILGGWGSAYFDVYLRLKAISRLLLDRCGPAMSRSKRRAMERFDHSDRSVTALLWLAARPLRRFFGHGETMGMERVLVRGILYRHLAGIKRRLPGRARRRVEDATALKPEKELTAQMRQKVAPLFPITSDSQPTRVNLLVPTIDLDHFFGGYIAKFNLARRLAEHGLRTRIVTVDPTPPLPDDWRDRIESFSQLDGLFDQVEVSFARDGREPFRTSHQDRFIATTWWTAHLATRLADTAGSERFLYLIQEYEPLTVPEGMWRKLARESYDFPHHALFSTDILAAFFRQEEIGVFGSGISGGGEALHFENAITPVEPPAEEDLRRREGRRLLLYGRPEAHAARNLWEVGVESLRRAVGAGTFGPEWTFHAIGTTGAGGKVDLGGGRSLELLPRTDQAAYARFLTGHDLGVALMEAPHPSLVPFEMASAGMPTITTTWGQSKTAESLGAISSNLIAVEPDPGAIAPALERAAGRSDDFPARLAGADFDWPRDWDQAFDGALLDRIAALLG